MTGLTRLRRLVRAARRTAPLPAAAVAACVLLPLPRPNVAQQPPAGSDWPMAAKDYANTRFSELDQFTPENVKDLKPAWTFDTGVHRGQEAARIVARNTMFVVTPFPNILHAFDLTRPGANLKRSPGRRTTPGRTRT